MQNLEESNDDSVDYPMETPRTEPDRGVNPPTAGVSRSAPRVWDRDVRGRKGTVDDHDWADPVLPEFFRELASQMARGVVQACQRNIGYEDGKNMRDFLDLAELDFIERGLEERLWGEELKRYLRGDALRYWLYLRRTGESLTDWEQLRQRFCEHFCSITLERMKAMLAKNVWRGDHRSYSARFADIVTQGVSVAPDLLVGYYLANLPSELLREVTQGGTRKFADWQAAAAALAATAAPWKDICEDHQRFRRDLEDASRRWDKGGRAPDQLRERETRDDRRNDTPDLRCYVCSGRGHGLTPFQSPRIGRRGCIWGLSGNAPKARMWGRTTSPIKEWTRRRMDRSGEQNDAATGGDRPQDADTEELQWWREQKVQEDTMPQGTLCSVGVWRHDSQLHRPLVTLRDDLWPRSSSK
ncbi:hypothetical protein ENH_00021010 [Eimeria necatrix]|uniref:Retrotransposon gag domain-containing protein n=1 Tax=Eimeria necatrix TaxID=51315 RepID=U6MLZ4_9EIME|nr:hypothetical protein ENH_00021010 [Eimeria necatrix]CDJ62675.1 hypothetical protein ENH_00021010 [Eimeria necatrix]